MRLTDFDRAYDYIRLNKSRNTFLESLFQQFERKGSLSEKQILAVLRDIERNAEKASKPPHDPVTEVGMYRNDEGVYRVKMSKGGNLYANRFDSEAQSKSDRFVYERGAIYNLSPANRMTVDEARAIGVESGICCVCGIELTDPKSVERGIGPVCAKKV